MHDVIIIGAGPGGYAAALRAAELGLNACLIEKDQIGGTCLNYGCIPTKSIVYSLKLLRNTKKAKAFGVEIPSYSVSIQNIQKRKDDIVSKLRQGAESQLQSKGVQIIRESAELKDKNTVAIEGKQLSARHIIIATGSIPSELKDIKFDHNHILSSADILSLNEIPKSLIIIGGGYIGCEFASIYNQLGSSVTVVEQMEQLLPNSDEEIARRLELNFKKAGINVLKGVKVSSCKVKEVVTITLSNNTPLEAEKVLVCVGRRPNTERLGLSNIGVVTDNNKVKVDNYLRTNIPNIYAIGDVTANFNLAHVATYEGVIAAENIAARSRPADYSAVPSCIFTTPEIASVGLSENEAKRSGCEFKVTKVPFSAISKAHIIDEPEGLIKLISEKKTGIILGAHIIGDSASELIAAFTIAIRNKLTIKTLSDVIYAHPTLSEVVLESATRAKEDK